jgi:DNA polymerase I
VMKLAMIRVHAELERRGLETKMILTIHDELLFEGPPSETDEVRAIAEAEMVAPWEDRTPPLAVDVGAGQTWLDAK